MPDADSDKSRTLSGETLPAGSNLSPPETALDSDATLIPASAGPAGFSFALDDLVAGRFRVIRFIARGGMGEVYEAEDLELKERVALKTVRLDMARDDRAVQRFRREIQLARKVTHPNICRTFDVFRHVEKDGGTQTEALAISMELLTGETLEERIRRNGKMPQAEALPIVAQICAGIQAAHRAGVIHRDFKSSNVILVRSESYPGNLRVVITDFGLAYSDTTRSGQSLTSTNDFVGTPGFMAPEQVQGAAITCATDIYALGVVLFEMVTGSMPFVAETALATALKRLNEPAPSPRSLSPELDPRWETGILRCLEREPADRFATADEVVPALAGETAPVLPRRLADSRRRKQVALAVVFSLVAVGVAGYFGERYRFQVSDRTRPSVAVLGFKNMSGGDGGEALGANFAENLGTELGTSEIHVVDAALVNQTEKQLGWREAPAALSPQELAKLRDLLDCDVVVFGSYTAEGSGTDRKIAWNIHLERTRKQSSLQSVRAVVSENSWLDAIPNVGSQVRAALGVQTPAEEASRIEASLPANTEASTDLAQGEARLANFDIQGARRLFEQAVRADPKFAQGHSALAEVWWQLGYEDEARTEAKTALDLSAGLGRDQHDLIQARYDAMNHNWDGATALYSSLWSDPSTREAEYGLLLASGQIDAGKSQDALRTLALVRDSKPAPGIRAQTDLAEARAHQALANYQEQLKASTTASNEAQALGATNLLARARILQCLAELNLGEPARAAPLCSDARRLNEAAGDKLGTANAVNAIANALSSQGDTEQALPLYREALEISKSIGDKLDEAGASDNLGGIKSTQGDYVGAEKYYQEGIEAASARGEKNELARTQMNLAMLWYQTGERDRASAMFDSAIHLAHSVGAKDIEARGLNNRCMMEEDSGNLNAAAKDCQNSLDLREAMSDKLAIARSWQNIGQVYAYGGDFAKAERAYQTALALQESMNAKNEAAYSNTLLAETSVLAGHPEAASAMAGAAATEFASEGDKDDEAEARRTLAEALLALGQRQNARVQIAQASQLVEQAHNRDLRLEIEITEAKLTAAEGHPGDGARALGRTRVEAREDALIAIEFEARLALGEMQLKAGSTADAKVTLRGLSRDAGAKGFAYIAARALKES
jgi:tetratricopeptide (TPR) repeat protein/tRNA A-37 threonylcarbamoyl transferase component Bud32